jgi:hypothetical protein
MTSEDDSFLLFDFLDLFVMGSPSIFRRNASFLFGEGALLPERQFQTGYNRGYHVSLILRSPMLSIEILTTSQNVERVIYEMLECVFYARYQLDNR